MPFLVFNNVDVEFVKIKKLIWRSYMAAEALLNTNRVKLIDKIEFAKVALDKDSETFVVYVAALEAETLIYLLWTAPIAALQYDNDFIEFPAEYLDTANVFFSDLAMEWPENMRVNKHAIELIDGK